MDFTSKVVVIFFVLQTCYASVPFREVKAGQCLTVIFVIFPSKFSQKKNVI